jgi:hypothetical protein
MHLQNNILNKTKTYNFHIITVDKKLQKHNKYTRI